MLFITGFLGFTTGKDTNLNTSIYLICLYWYLRDCLKEGYIRVGYETVNISGNVIVLVISKYCSKSLVTKRSSSFILSATSFATSVGLAYKKNLNKLLQTVMTDILFKYIIGRKNFKCSQITNIKIIYLKMFKPAFDMQNLMFLSFV